MFLILVFGGDNLLHSQFSLTIQFSSPAMVCILNIFCFVYFILWKFSTFPPPLLSVVVRAYVYSTGGLIFSVSADLSGILEAAMPFNQSLINFKLGTEIYAFQQWAPYIKTQKSSKENEGDHIKNEFSLTTKFSFEEMTTRNPQK